MNNNEKQEKIELTAIRISQGIIELIDEEGEIKYYRQRGIQRIPINNRMLFMKYNLLAKNWGDYDELPKQYTLSYEEPEIQGRACVTFPSSDKLMKLIKNYCNRSNNS